MKPRRRRLTCALRQFDTCRLIPSRFADVEDSVLAPAGRADDALLRDLFDLDNATNDRLRGESGQLPGIGIDELVFGLPNFRIVNAAFTYPRPEGSRFNDGERGAWYCAFELDTALAEVSFHKTVEYQEIGRFDDSVSYQALLADFGAPLPRLARQTPPMPHWADCLDPASYIASQQLAAELLERRLDGHHLPQRAPRPAAPTWPAFALPWWAMCARARPTASPGRARRIPTIEPI